MMRLDDLFDHYDVKEIRDAARSVESGPGGDGGDVGSSEHELRRIASLIEKHISPPAPDHPFYEWWGGFLSRPEIDTFRLYAGKYDKKLGFNRGNDEEWQEAYRQENRDIIGKYYDEEPPRPENAI